MCKAFNRTYIFVFACGELTTLRHGCLGTLWSTACIKSEQISILVFGKGQGWRMWCAWGFAPALSGIITVGRWPMAVVFMGGVTRSFSWWLRPGVIAGYLSETRSVLRSKSKAIRIQIRLSTSQADTKKLSMAGVAYWEFGQPLPEINESVLHRGVSGTRLNLVLFASSLGAL